MVSVIETTNDNNDHDKNYGDENAATTNTTAGNRSGDDFTTSVSSLTSFMNQLLNESEIERLLRSGEEEEGGRDYDDEEEECDDNNKSEKSLPSLALCCSSTTSTTSRTEDSSSRSNNSFQIESLRLKPLAGTTTSTTTTTSSRKPETEAKEVPSSRRRSNRRWDASTDLSGVGIVVGGVGGRFHHNRCGSKSFVDDSNDNNILLPSLGRAIIRRGRRAIDLSGKVQVGGDHQHCSAATDAAGTSTVSGSKNLLLPRKCKSLGDQVLTTATMRKSVPDKDALTDGGRGRGEEGGGGGRAAENRNKSKSVGGDDKAVVAANNLNRSSNDNSDTKEDNRYPQANIRRCKSYSGDKNYHTSSIRRASSNSKTLEGGEGRRDGGVDGGSVGGVDPDFVQQLQDENVALRAQLAQYQQRDAAATEEVGLTLEKVVPFQGSISSLEATTTAAKRAFGQTNARSERPTSSSQPRKTGVRRAKSHDGTPKAITAAKISAGTPKTKFKKRAKSHDGTSKNKNKIPSLPKSVQRAKNRGGVIISENAMESITIPAIPVDSLTAATARLSMSGSAFTQQEEKSNSSIESSFTSIAKAKRRANSHYNGKRAIAASAAKKTREDCENVTISAEDIKRASSKNKTAKECDALATTAATAAATKNEEAVQQKSLRRTKSKEIGKEGSIRKTKLGGGIIKEAYSNSSLENPSRNSLAKEEYRETSRRKEKSIPLREASSCSSVKQRRHLRTSEWLWPKRADHADSKEKASSKEAGNMCSSEIVSSARQRHSGINFSAPETSSSCKTSSRAKKHMFSASECIDSTRKSDLPFALQNATTGLSKPEANTKRELAPEGRRQSKQRMASSEAINSTRKSTQSTAATVGMSKSEDIHRTRTNNKRDVTPATPEVRRETLQSIAGCRSLTTLRRPLTRGGSIRNSMNTPLSCSRTPRTKRLSSDVSTFQLLQALKQETPAMPFDLDSDSDNDESEDRGNKTIQNPILGETKLSKLDELELRSRHSIISNHQRETQVMQSALEDSTSQSSIDESELLDESMPGLIFGLGDQSEMMSSSTGTGLLIGNPSAPSRLQRNDLDTDSEDDEFASDHCTGKQGFGLLLDSVV